METDFLDEPRAGRGQPPHTIATSLASLSFEKKSDATIAAEAAKDEAILAELAKLSLVYWRPDFTPTQAKQLYAMYIDDLRAWSLADIKSACKTYRRNGENRFFPTPGQLLDLIAKPPKWWVSGVKEWQAERRQEAKAELVAIEQKYLAPLNQKRIEARAP